MNIRMASYVLAGVAVVAVVAIPAVFVEAVRLLLLVAFCLLVPGLGWARRVGGGGAVDTVALAGVISMSATILVSTAMVVLNVWSAPGGVAVLIAIALLGFSPLGRGASSPRAQS